MRTDRPPAARTRHAERIVASVLHMHCSIGVSLAVHFARQLEVIVLEGILAGCAGEAAGMVFFFVFSVRLSFEVLAFDAAVARFAQ